MTKYSKTFKDKIELPHISFCFSSNDKSEVNKYVKTINPQEYRNKFYHLFDLVKGTVILEDNQKDSNINLYYFNK